MNQSLVLFARSDWILNLGISFAIDLQEKLNDLQVRIGIKQCLGENSYLNPECNSLKRLKQTPITPCIFSFNPANDPIMNSA